MVQLTTGLASTAVNLSPSDPCLTTDARRVLLAAALRHCPPHNNNKKTMSWRALVNGYMACYGRLRYGLTPYIPCIVVLVVRVSLRLYDLFMNAIAQAHTGATENQLAARR
eukprot:scaffold3208_cov113-Isochrysis_galbana.AAC.1